MVSKNKENWPLSRMKFSFTSPELIKDGYRAFYSKNDEDYVSVKTNFFNILKKYSDDGTLNVLLTSDGQPQTLSVTVSINDDGIINHEIADSLNKAFQKATEPY